MAGTVRYLLLAAGLAACGPAAKEPAGPTSPTQAAASDAPAGHAPAIPVTPANEWPLAQSDDPAAQLDRLAKDPGPLKSNWVPPGKSDRYGHAEGLVAAPYEAVRAKVLDYAHYKDLAGPKFKNVRIVGKEADATDVYFNLPIMKGLVTIWYVTRFTPPRTTPGGEIVEGTFVKGNVKGMHIAFTLRHGKDPASTVLTCDLLLSLGIPAPQENVDEELRDACGDAIVSVRRTTAAPPPP